MDSFTTLSLLLTLTLTINLQTQTQAQTPPAPGPAPGSGPVNITAILENGGQFTTFIRFITENSNQIANQVNTQVNSSTEGMTVFAPTDNAFTNLPAGTLNRLSDNQHVQLILYHVLPKYYSLRSLLTVSNPVRTQASGQDGGVFGLNFTGNGNQVNVSTGIVDTLLNNALRDVFPLAVYQVDKVLLPVEFYQAKSPASSPTAPAVVNSTESNGTRATGDAPGPDSGSGRMSVGLGLVGLFCMGLLMIK